MENHAKGSTPSFQKIIWITAVLYLSLLLFSCEKHVTPDKVSRKLSDENWRVSSFSFQDSSETLLFTGKLFAFTKNGSISVVGEYATTGYWTMGESKKPTVLYIEAFLQDPYFKLNDDWEVLSCSSTTIKLQSEDGIYTNTMTLMKDD